ncbi:MAG TPA: BsuPI-related putative proteinase inhibitor, partial [Bacillales bacterium]|nr:BsuPI-related putative proteinase inhibitor [Bacillales bacterium]
MLLLAFSFLGGCGQSAKSGNADGSTGTTSGGSQSGSGFAAGEIQTWIDWNQQGDTVKFTFHLKNQTEHVQTFTFPTGQRFDFVIKNEQGQKVKQYSEGRMFTQMVGEVTLKQAEEISYDAEV